MSHVRTPGMARILPLITGLALGALALGPGLRRGFLLSYDMVFVPQPPLTAAALGVAGGPPRAVPSDAVVAVLARALPSDIVEKLVLLSIFMLACSGVAAMLRALPLPVRLAAGAFYSWNPYVAERLILGQWALLLGYAGLPWVISAIASGTEGWRGAARLCLALVPAAIGGFAAMSVSALVAGAAALVAPAAQRTPSHRARTRHSGRLAACWRSAALGMPRPCREATAASRPCSGCYSGWLACSATWPGAAAIHAGPGLALRR